MIRAVGLDTVLLAGGGTGGHLFPGVAVAEAVARNAPGARGLLAFTERDSVSAHGAACPLEKVRVDSPRRPRGAVGVPVFGAWTWNEAIGLGITTEVDDAEAYHSLRTVRGHFRTTTAVTLVLILAMGAFFQVDKRRRHHLMNQIRASEDCAVTSITRFRIVPW